MRGAVSRRPAVRLAAVGAAALLAGLLPGSGSAAEEREARVTAAYGCELPAGSQKIEAGISGSFPDAAVAGKPIQPGDVQLTITLPAVLVEAMFREGTEAVQGKASLAVEVAQGEESAKADWSGLSAPETPLKAGESLELTHSGGVPWVQVGGAGDVTFTAGELGLSLSPSPGEADAEPVELSCTPEGGGELLGTVGVSAVESESPEASPSQSSSPGAEDSDGDPGLLVEPEAEVSVRDCPKEAPDTEPDPDRLPPLPPEAVRDPPREPLSQCAIPTGFSTVRKLDGSMIVNDARKGQLGLMHLAVRQSTYRWVIDGEEWRRDDSSGVVLLPDAESTFLTFGFQPTTAQVTFEAGPATLVTTSNQTKNTTTIEVGYSQHLRLHDVRVNGVPLDVGPNCRTSTPIDKSS